MDNQPTDFEIELMRQALALAARGRGRVEPNPMVACIVARDDQVIGSGYHQAFGQPHAEPNALAACTQSPAGATAIVTLEPCCHTAKKTPPCVPQLIAHGIRRIVIGCLDPNPAVSGQGAAQLRGAGIEVISAVLEPHARQLIAPYFALTRHHRPYVTLKWAQSADGRVGGAGNTPRQISCPESQRLLHQLRSRCDAILISADTVLSDNPSLTVRDVPSLRTPLRVILDTHLRIPSTSRLALTARKIPVHVFHADTLTQTPAARTLAAMGLHLHPTAVIGDHVSLPAVLQALGDMQLTHLLIEPGPRLAQAFLDAQLADRLWVFQSPTSLHEPSGPQSPAIAFPPTTSHKISVDTLCEYLFPTSAVYFSPDPSPDFQLFGHEH